MLIIIIIIINILLRLTDCPINCGLKCDFFLTVMDQLHKLFVISLSKKGYYDTLLFPSSGELRVEQREPKATEQKKERCTIYKLHPQKGHESPQRHHTCTENVLTYFFNFCFCFVLLFFYCIN